MALSLHNAKGVQGIGDQAEVQYKTAGAGGVTAGDWVALSGGTVVAADSSAPPAEPAIGVALDTAIDGQSVRVCTAGPCTAAVTHALAAGVCLTAGAATAGLAILWDNTAASGDGGVCGITTGPTAIDDTAPVYVIRRLY